jgi:hypothetical protein
MGIKISEMTLDSSIGGAELIPVSDAGSPKRVVVGDLKNYVVDQIEAIAAGTAVTGADGVFILQAGAMKPVDIDLVAQHAIDTIWGKAAISTADGADVLAAKDDGTTEKTMTLTTLKTYIAGAIYSSGLTLATLDAAGALVGADVLLVNQSGTPKRTTLTAVNAAIYAALNAYVTALGANSSPADSDVFYCIQGGVEKKVTLSTLKGVFGSVIAPATTTENKLPQWASGQKTLKDGLTLRTAVRANATADDTSVPTEKAVRDLEKALVYSQTDIGADLADADEMIVDDGGTGTTQRKSALTRMWTYIWSKVSGATAKTTPVDADSIGVVDSAASSVVKNVTLYNLWTNFFLAKAKLVKLDELAATTDVTTLNASVSVHGLLPKLGGGSVNFLRADGTWAAPTATATKLDDFAATDDNTDLNASTTAHGLLLKATAPAAGLVNVVGIANGETAYTNKALFDASAPAALGTAATGTSVAAARRDHIHDMPKLDDCTTPDDNTDLDASVTRHGLLPKLEGGAVKFLRADGTWVEPGVAVGWDGDIADMDIDGGTDIGADLADADLVVVDDGAGGTNRKSALSRFWTYIWTTKANAASKTTGVDADKVIISDSADANNAKTFALSNLWSYIESKVQATASKATGVDNDITVIQDSAASFGLREFTLASMFNYIQSKFVLISTKSVPVGGDFIVIKDSAAPTALKLSTFTQLWNSIYLALAKTIKLDEMTACTDVTTLDASGSAHGLMPKLDKIKLDAMVGDTDGTLATGANNDFVAAKLVYNKTCSDSTGDDVIDLHDATVVGRVLTIYLGTKSGSDNAVITPVTKLGYSTITLDAANEMATLQWQGSTVGWVILHTTGTVA